ILRTFTITPGGAASAGGMSPVIQAAYAGAPVAGSSAQMMPVDGPSASAMRAAMPASISQAFVPHASSGHAPNVSANLSAGFQQPGKRMGSPLLWAGGGILLTAGLIGFGMWMVRPPASDKAQSIAPAPTAAIAPAAAIPAPAAQPAASSIMATSAAPVPAPAPRPVVVAAVVPPAAPAIAAPVAAPPNALTNGTL